MAVFHFPVMLMDANLTTRGIVIALYFMVVIALGFIARSRGSLTPDRYFLADRRLGTFVLVITLAATNFSAFTVFGASGAGYRDGLAFFPIMAFGTGFMALTFWLIGRRVWELGKEHGLITPAELVGLRYDKNPVLIFLFALVMIVFTVPYLAIQPMAGAGLLEGLFNIRIEIGAMLITGIILLYTLRGGLRAVAWTDVFQGLFMVTLMIVALIMVANHHGGLTAGLSQANDVESDLFSRPGLTGKYTPAMWFSFMTLWFFCDPMFPQLFQRFYAAKSPRSLGVTTILYPAICTVVFFIPVTIGVLGHLTHPNLENADNIMTLLMRDIGGDMMGTLVLAAGLAALMSTMDSQLLTLSSIFTRDIFPFFKRGKIDAGNVLTARIFVAALAVAGLVIALNPQGSIVDIAVKQAFTGLAVLFPTVLFGIWLEKPRPLSAIFSIISGEMLLILYAIPALNLPTWGFLPAIPIIALSIITYVIIQEFQVPGSFGIIRKIPARTALYIAGFILIFILAMDIPNWGKSEPFYFGLPFWAYWFIFLSAVQTALTYTFLRPMLQKS